VTVVLVQHLSLKPQHTNASIPPPAKSALALPDKPSIAVLPFANLSGDPEQEYFSDGITDDLITDLSRLPGLFVIARTSSFSYKGKLVKLQDVGTELGVKYVLQGSVRKAGGQVRITAQLADASTGVELWAERYDRPLRDIFTLQDEIVRRIATTSNLQLNLAQQGILIPRSTENLEAYDDLLRGTEYSLSVTQGGITKAREMFEKAIKLDPGYAVAYAMLAENLWSSWVLGLIPTENFVDRALKLEQRAIALDDSLGFAHGGLAVMDMRARRYDDAIAEAHKEVALDPNSSTGYFHLAQVLVELGRGTEALAAVRSAMRLDPLFDENYKPMQGWAYTLLGRWDEAISLMKPYVARYPDNFFIHVLLAEDYAALGDKDAAQAEVAEVQRHAALNPNSTFGYVVLAQALNATGRPTEALAAAERFIRLDPNERVYYLNTQGWAYSQLGRWQEAISVLPRSTPFPWVHLWLAVDYVELGRDDAARAEIARVLKLDPQYSLKIGVTEFPANQQRAAADLHKAGLN
jgi:adenylate cyclase